MDGGEMKKPTLLVNENKGTDNFRINRTVR